MMHHFAIFAIGLVAIFFGLSASFLTGHMLLSEKDSSSPPISVAHQIALGMFTLVVVGGVIGLIYCMGLFAILLIS